MKFLNRGKRSNSKIGGGKETRTPDIQLAKLALYQLSYTPLFFKVVGLGGLGPPTLRLSGVRSNHLSYKPVRGRISFP